MRPLKIISPILVAILLSTPTPALAQGSSGLSWATQLFYGTKGQIPSTLSSVPLNYAEVNQGDRIKVGNNYCTVGWIDRVNSRAYTAAHCGAGVESKETFNDKGQSIGVLLTNPFGNNPRTDSDSGYVQLDYNVTPGENIYTKELSLLSPDEVNIGDKVCVYGSSTGEVLCTNITNPLAVTNQFALASGTEVSPGDSGGPAWIPGKGVMGVVSSARQSPDGGWGYIRLGYIYPTWSYLQTNGY